MPSWVFNHCTKDAVTSNIKCTVVTAGKRQGGDSSSSAAVAEAEEDSDGSCASSGAAGEAEAVDIEDIE